MKSEYAIEVFDIGKFFSRDVEPNSLREAIANRFNNNKKRDGFWALKNISFTLPMGAVLGILGHNGAGKSILLKILAGVIKPTIGEAIIRGRVGALLELGTGFHPELSGRDNIYLNGTLIGFSRSQINKHTDDIINFSGLGEFIDDPVKHYSSGMMMRLAFSIATTLVPEIVFLDEVWAVGDAEFQDKSAKRVKEIISEGRTVIIVSHSVETVKNICTHCLLLSKGEALMFGDPVAVIDLYNSIIYT